MTLHKEGTKTIILALLFAGTVYFLIQYFFPTLHWLQLVIGILAIAFVGVILNFFRIPKLNPHKDPNIVLCPADGKVVVIEEVEETEYFKEKRLQVSVFMSPLNVHNNRNPIGGKVKYVKYHPGKYLVAWHPKSSTENERHTVVLEDQNKVEILVRQIAGALARRIMNYLEEEEEVQQGAEFGFIKFGSRVDTFLPLDAKVEVELNQKVKGGVTILARLN